MEARGAVKTSKHPTWKREDDQPTIGKDKPPGGVPWAGEGEKSPG